MRLKYLVLTLIFSLVISTPILIEIFYYNNFGVVIPGKIYRSAQPSTHDLQEWQKQYGIKSIINLRGESDHSIKYNENSLELTSSRVPYPQELISLIELINKAERPVLLHCKHGSDRTSLASAVALLLNDASIDDAINEFSIMHGFLSFLQQGVLRLPFYDYKNWLAERNLLSTKKTFIFWAKNFYKPYYYGAELEIINLKSKIMVNHPQFFMAKITNTTAYPIQFTKESLGGVYLGRCLYSKPDPDMICSYLNYHLIENAITVPMFNLAKIDQLNYILKPGETMNVPILLPAIQQPGTYVLELVLMEKDRFRFNEYGNETVRQNLEVV